jgi:hypothetical protein
MKLGQLIDSVAALNKLMASDFRDLTLSYRLNRLANEANQHVQSYLEAEKKLVTEMSVPRKGGEKGDRWIPPQKMQDFLDRRAPLRDIEVELKIPVVTLDDLKGATIVEVVDGKPKRSPMPLKPLDIGALIWLIQCPDVQADAPVVEKKGKKLKKAI